MRKDHAILDIESRQRKTAKIIRIIEHRKDMAGVRVLEIGTGSGVTAATLAKYVGPKGAVHATDVKDQRITCEGYEFHQVTDTKLPFEDKVFDVVISNHVIEHVGSRNDQLNHLKEIKRVMRPDGLLYLAVPNKWRLIEPHYRIPLLSWFPKKIADGVVKCFGKNDEFDCRSPSRRELRELLSRTSLVHTELDREAMKIVAEIEQSKTAFVLSILPETIFKILLTIVPTLIVLAVKEKS